MSRITRRQSLTSMLPAALLPSLTGAAASRRPNIVLVMTDDQGYGDIAAHGNPIIRTPNLDRMHGESVRLADFHVSPTCAPTRSALLTGKHEFKNGVTHTIYERERLSLKSTTIAQVLKGAGYATGIFGKWHLGDAAEYQPGRRGFEETFIHGCGGIGQSYPGTCADAPGNSYFDPYVMHNGRFEKTKGYCTDVFFGQAMRWMEARRSAGAGNQPFFAYITPNAPHTPLDCPESYEAQYRDAGVKDPRTAKFLGMVTNIDDNMGRLMTGLSQWGIERDTLLIFMNDNGGTGGVAIFNDGMRGQKVTPYLGGTRAAGFFRWPGTFTPGAVTQMCAHIDMFPTLAEIAGAKTPREARVDGRSIAGLLRGDARVARNWKDRYLFTHVGRWEKGKAAESKYVKCRIRNARYSMVNQGRGPEGWELYDLTVDRGEKKDVSKSRPEVVREMSAAYDKWWAEVLPLLVNEDAVPPAVAPYRDWFEKQYGAKSGRG